MIKPLSIVAIAILFCCQSNVSNEEVTASGSRKIKMLTESSHDPIIKAGKFQSSQKLSKNSFFHESYFDKSGRLVRKNTFNLKAVLVSKTVFDYDERDNNIETLVYHSDGSLSKKNVSEFDSKNRLTQCHEYDAFGKILSKKITTQDSLGRRVLTFYERSNSRLVKKLESYFDNEEKNIANHHFSDEMLSLEEIQAYDTNANVIETIQRNVLTNEETIIRFTYDKKNNKVAEIILKNNLVTGKTTYRYDDKNKLIETNRYGVQSTLEERCEYVFESDPYGNWTKRTELVNDRPTAVLIRRIEYY